MRVVDEEREAKTERRRKAEVKRAIRRRTLRHRRWRRWAEIRRGEGRVK